MSLEPYVNELLPYYVRCTEVFFSFGTDKVLVVIENLPIGRQVVEITQTWGMEAPMGKVGGIIAMQIMEYVGVNEEEKEFFAYLEGGEESNVTES